MFDRGDDEPLPDPDPTNAGDGGDERTRGYLSEFITAATGFGVRLIIYNTIPTPALLGVVRDALATIHERKITPPRHLEYADLHDASTFATYYDTDDRIVINVAAEFWDEPYRAMKLLYDTRTLVSADPRAIVYHEVGHAQHRRQYRLGWRWWRVSSRRLSMDELLVADRVSLYAAVDTGEFVAETFAGLLTDCSFDDEVMALYRKLRGPIP